MLNDAQRKLQEELIFTQVSHVMKDQKAATGIKRTELDPKYHVLSKVALFDTPYSDLEFENKTIIAYNTALTREYMAFGICKEWKLFSYTEFQNISKSTIVLFVDGLKVWYKDIQVRVRKEQIFFIVPKKVNIESITVIEVPKTPHNVFYMNENKFDLYHSEYIANPPIGFADTGEFNLIEDPPVYSDSKESDDFKVRVYNENWNGNEYEVYQPHGGRGSVYLGEESKLTTPHLGFNYREWTGQYVPAHKDSILVFSNGKLLHPSEYTIEYIMRTDSEYSRTDYRVYFYANKIGRYHMLTYDDAWTKLEFTPYNIITRYDKFFEWGQQEWQGLLPDFITKYKDLEFAENDLFGDDQSVFFKTMSRAIGNFPEWYNRYLDTISQDRKFIMYKDLQEDWKHKLSNRAEVESRFQAVDFVTEHVMLNIRNERRSDDIAIYFNGLKYTGIRHIIHSRNFSFIYILKSALGSITDDSYFELEIKPESYYTVTHSARFNGDAMLVINVDDPKFPFNGNLEKIKFFFNGKCIRRRDVLYAKDLEGNHSFFFNIKVKVGDIMSIEYSDVSLKEVTYLNKLPVNGVLNIDSATLKYPLSTKYYEIYINGRRMSYNNEHFISNFLIQFKYIKGNYHIVIYEKSSIDVSELNNIFNNTTDEWDKFVKSDIVPQYLTEHVIEEDNPYDTFTYTLAQHRMHLFYWWFIVPRDLTLDASPAAADSVYNEIKALFPDFINSKGEIVLDSKTSQTSKMLLSNNYRGTVANIEHLVTENRPIDSNVRIPIDTFPSKGMVDGAARMNVQATGLPRLMIVPTPKK